MKRQKVSTIRDFQDLKVEKAKLKVALSYDREKLEHNYHELKRAAADGHIISEGVRIVGKAIATNLNLPLLGSGGSPGSSAESGLPANTGELMGSLMTAISNTGKGGRLGWIQAWLPFVVGLLNTAIRTYLNRKKG